jgi:cytochrome c
MHTSAIPTRLMLLYLVTIAALLVVTLVPSPLRAAPAFKVLVFSRSVVDFHPTAEAIEALQRLGVQHNFEVVASDDLANFDSYETLAQYRAIIFNNNCIEGTFNAQQWASFQQYIRAGGGFVGFHCVSLSERGNPWFVGLVGATFAGHPRIQQGVLVVQDRQHPSTRSLPQRWDHIDEWYTFTDNPRARVRVLLTVDETTYDPETYSLGADHPISWCHNYDGGRSWYTALGHRPEAFSEPRFLQHLLGGILWAAGAKSADCTPRAVGFQQHLSLISYTSVTSP